MTRKLLGSLIGCFVIGAALVAGAAAETQNAKQARADADQQPLIIFIRGSNLYKTYCASCHGENAKGNGPMAVWLKVPPPDLTQIAVRNGGKFPLEKVARIIAGEEALPSGHGPRAMPLWGPIFSQVIGDQNLRRVRIDNLARYLRDIQSKAAPPIPTAN
jgi:mono/diheme cytochrome c family protein